MPEGAIAFIEKQRGALRITAVDRAAQALGVTPGMALADARAALPDLPAVERDLAAEAKLIAEIADGCERWSPTVELDPPDGVTIDITGCAHLCGGEAALAEDAARRFARAGLSLRHALGPTPDAAQALARHQSAPATSEDAAIRRLPIAALRLEDEVALALRRAGLRTVGDLAGRPSSPISARFGEATRAALDRLLGRADDRLDPRRVPPDLALERRFAEPIAHLDSVMEVVGAMLVEAAIELRQREKGGRRFAIRLYRSDGAVRDLAVETALPTRDPQAALRLFAERVEALADPIDPGFGFDMIRLRVPVMQPLAPTQLRLEGGEVNADALAALVDRLSTRIGRGRVRRLIPADSHLPEQGVLALPAIEAARPAPWPAPAKGEPPLRPLHLFDPPQRIEVVAEVPDGPPHRFRWRRATHEVTRFEGPERIAAEWWKQLPGREAPTRDYYRVEDVRGRRFWIFRHGLYGEERAHPGWYLHGLFA